MNHVKTVWEGDYGLQHLWYYDDMGLQKNSFDLIHHPKDGSRTYYPFWGTIRVATFDKGTALVGDDISPYTENEYLEMLKEQVAKIKSASPSHTEI